MKFSVTSLSTLLLLFSTLAQSTSHSARSLSLRSTRPDRRSPPTILQRKESGRRRRTNLATGPFRSDSVPIVPRQSDTPTSDNWAGAILFAPSGQPFNAASGQFVVPAPEKPPGGMGKYGATIWIGLDGYDTNFVLQAGVKVEIDADGSISYSVFYEWYPYLAQYTSEITAEAGDTISISILSPDPSTGVITIKNLSQDQEITFNLQSPGPGSNVVGRTAEWIVEDYKESILFGIFNVFAPFVNFGSVVFTEVFASSNGLDVDIGNAVTTNIVQNNVLLATASIDNSRQVSIYYA